jgi:hypothetical protein
MLRRLVLRTERERALVKTKIVSERDAAGRERGLLIAEGPRAGLRLLWRVCPFGKAAQFLLSPRADIKCNGLHHRMLPVLHLVINQPLKTKRPDWAFQ